MSSGKTVKHARSKQWHLGKWNLEIMWGNKLCKWVELAYGGCVTLGLTCLVFTTKSTVNWKALIMGINTGVIKKGLTCKKKGQASPWTILDLITQTLTVCTCGQFFWIGFCSVILGLRNELIIYGFQNLKFNNNQEKVNKLPKLNYFGFNYTDLDCVYMWAIFLIGFCSVILGLRNELIIYGFQNLNLITSKKR